MFAPLDTIELKCPESRKLRNELIHTISVLVCSGFLVSIVLCTVGLDVDILWTSVLGTILGCLYLMRRASNRKWLPTNGKAVVVTGCDTGFGNWLVRRLDELGVVVFAGCLHADGEYARELRSASSDHVYILQMDVSRDEQIQKCLETVTETLQKHKINGLWGVVNNAGLNFLGDVELTSMEQFRREVNINQLGMVCVTKTFLPLVKVCKGRIVNVTSVKGILPLALCSAYCMTKFAGEAFSDILRMEMRKFDVGVAIVEPGNFGGVSAALQNSHVKNDVDEMWNSLPNELRQEYGRPYLDFYHKTLSSDAIPTTCRQVYLVLDAMLDGLFASKPQHRYLIEGSLAWFDIYIWRAYAWRYLPSWLMDNHLMKDLEGYFPPPQILQKKNK